METADLRSTLPVSNQQRCATSLPRQLGQPKVCAPDQCLQGDGAACGGASCNHRTSQQEKFDICRWAALWKKYAGAKNRAAMAALLSPVQRVAEQSKLARELLDFSSVFLHILIRLALGTRLSSSSN